jgi:hypothetical protein
MSMLTTGMGLTPHAVTVLEQRFERLLGLKKWFVTVSPLRP